MSDRVWGIGGGYRGTFGAEAGHGLELQVRRGLWEIAPGVEIGWNPVLTVIPSYSAREVTLSRDDVLSRNYPTVEDRPGAETSSVDGGTETDTTTIGLLTTPLQFSLLWRPDGWSGVAVGPVLGLGIAYAKEESSTVVHRTSGTEYNAEQYDTSGCIPGDIYCEGTPIPAPEVAQPGANNDIGPFQASRNALGLLTRVGLAFAYPLGGAHFLHADLLYQNRAGVSEGGVFFGYAFYFGASAAAGTGDK